MHNIEQSPMSQCFRAVSQPFYLEETSTETKQLARQGIETNFPSPQTDDVLQVHQTSKILLVIPEFDNGHQRYARVPGFAFPRSRYFRNAGAKDRKFYTGTRNAKEKERYIRVPVKR